MSFSGIFAVSLLASFEGCSFLRVKFVSAFSGNMRRGSAVGIATACGLDGREVGVESRWGQEFSLPRIVQTDSGVYPTSYPMGTEGSPG
jgi:hypothetical protein